MRKRFITAIAIAAGSVALFASQAAAGTTWS